MADTAIANLIIKISAQVGDVQKSLNDVKGQVKGFASDATGPLALIKQKWLEIAAAVGAVYGTYKSINSIISTTTQLGMETYKLQKATGLTAEEASTLINVAEDLGISYETISRAVTSVVRRMGGLKDIESQVTDETGKSVDVFEKWGIEVKNADGSAKKFMEVFNQIRDRIRGAGDQTKQLMIATQFFVRQGAQELLPLLTISDEEFKIMAEDMKKYGVVIGQSTVNQVKAFIFAHHDLDDAISGLKITIGNELIPVLITMTHSIAETIKNFKDFVNLAKNIKPENWAILKEIIRETAAQLEIMIGIIAAIILLNFGAHIAGWATGFYLLGASIASFILSSPILLAILTALGTALVALAADAALYWATGGKVDISGWNKVRELTKEQTIQQSYLNQRAEGYNKILANLGFIGPKAMKEFNTAVKEGKVVWDEVSKSWKKIVDQTGDTTGTDAAKKALDSLAKKTEDFKAQTLALADPIAGSRQELENWIAETTKGVKSTPELSAKIKELRTAFEIFTAEKGTKTLQDKIKDLQVEILKLSDPIAAETLAFQKFVEDIRKQVGTLPDLEKQLKTGKISTEGYEKAKKVIEDFNILVPEATQNFLELQKAIGKKELLEVQIKVDLSAVTQANELELTQLESNYKKGLVSLEDYYARRRAIIESNTEAEVNALAKSVTTETSEAKTLEISTQITQKWNEQTKQRIVLTDEETDALQRQKEITDELDLAEIRRQREELTISRLDAAVKSKIILEDQIDSLVQIQARIEQGSDAWLDYEKRISSARDELIEYNRVIREQTGTLGAGMIRGLKEWLDEAQTIYQAGVELAKEAANAMQGAFEDFFFDAMTGKFKNLRDYILSFRDSIFKELSKIASTELTKGIFSIVKILFPDMKTPEAKPKGTYDSPIWIRDKDRGAVPKTGEKATSELPPEIAATKPAGEGWTWNAEIGAWGRSTEHPELVGKTVEEAEAMTTPKEGNILGDVWKEIKDVFGSLIKTFKDVFSSLGDSLGSIFSGAVDMLDGLFDSLGSGLSDIVSGLISMIGGIFGFAEGGRLGGKAGTDANIYAGTAGEYVEPVPSVKYYGEQIFEALRRRSIPRENILSLISGNLNISRPDFAFAGGGEISPQKVGGTTLSIYVPVSMDDKRLASHIRTALEDEVPKIIERKIKEFS